MESHVVGCALLAIVALPSVVALNSSAQLRTPPELDCSDRPAWDQFRRGALAHSDRGWPLDGAEAEALRAEAEAIEKRWRHLVCTEDCLNSDDLRWGFVESLGHICSDSPQFDRYLVTHYFRNRGLVYGSLATEADRSEFCFAGYIMALVILAQFEFPRSVGVAQRFLFRAFLMLGDFFSFEWLQSFGWPVSLWQINIHLFLFSQRWMPAPGSSDIISQHPGIGGSERIMLLQRWIGVGERTKPSWWAPIMSGSPPLIGRTVRPYEIVVWQACQHTTVVGEAKTMLTRFQRSVGVNIRFVGNSIAASVCRNYGLCISPEVRDVFLRHIRSYEKDGNFAEVVARFVIDFRPIVSGADVLMCTQPPSWCRFFLAFGDKPVWMYAGLPLVWGIRDEDKLEWLQEVVAMAQDDRHIFTASSVFMAHEMHWQVGVLPPVIRMMGLHTMAVHAPLRPYQVLVSRFGSSAGMAECVLNRFLATNPDYPLRFVQLEALLFETHMATTGQLLDGMSRWEEHKGDIKTAGMPYQAIAEHRAAIVFPYDAVIFLFHELYSLQIPLLVPFELWRWLHGPLTLPSMSGQVDNGNESEDLPRPPYSPFFAPRQRPVYVDQANHWAALTDWALMQHILYFHSAADLLSQLLDERKLRTTSAQMKAFNELQLVEAIEGWRRVAGRLVYVTQASRSANPR